MKRTLKSFRKQRGRRGNALVEFGIIAPVLLLMTCAVCDFSRLFNVAITAAGAAEAGVYFAATAPEYWSDYADIRTAALNDTGNYSGATATASNWCTCSVGGAQVTCPTSCPNTPVNGYEYVQVSVTIPFTPVFNYPGLPNPISITQTLSGKLQ